MKRAFVAGSLFFVAFLAGACLGLLSTCAHAQEVEINFTRGHK